VYRAVCRAFGLALLLAACSGGPLREDVIAQANQQGEIAFNLVKIDEAVATMLAQRQRPAFHRRFKNRPPPPLLRIAVGDTVSVVIWESAANGLFGNSMTSFAAPAEPAASLSLGRDSVRERPSRLTDETAASDQTARTLRGAAEAILSTPVEPRAATPPRRDGGTALDIGDVSDLRQTEPGDQSGRPGTRIPDQPVGTDGAITIPYAGRIKVVGRTPDEVERRIEALLRPIALDPQALVAVKRSAANAVTVTGDALKGARVPLSPGGDRLLDVIGAAGGATEPVHETFVRLSRGEIIATIPLARLVADPEQNIFAEPGDVLTVLRQPQTVSVFGATGKNAAVTFATERMSLTEALAKAGGLLDDRADPRAVFLLRYEPVELVRALGQPIATRAPAGISPIVYRLDLLEAKSYLLAKQVPVQDKDIIFVANAETVPITHALRVLSKVTGPIAQGLLICQTTANC
jgi:polysaccharide export outer membrane protein